MACVDRELHRVDVMLYFGTMVLAALFLFRTG